MPPCHRHLAAAFLVALSLMLAAPLGAAANHTTKNTTTNDSGLETWQGALIVAGGLALLVGIGLAIARDARTHAPADPQETTREQRDADGHKRSREAKVHQRQKQKAARASRRKNR